MPPKMLRIDEVCELLGVGDDVLREWIDAGRLRAFKPSPRVLRVSAAEVEAFIERNSTDLAST